MCSIGDASDFRTRLSLARWLKGWQYDNVMNHASLNYLTRLQVYSRFVQVIRENYVCMKKLRLLFINVKLWSSFESISVSLGPHNDTCSKEIWEITWDWKKRQHKKGTMHCIISRSISIFSIKSCLQIAITILIVSVSRYVTWYKSLINFDIMRCPLISLDCGVS